MGTWLNSDGLYLRFGTDEDTNTVTAGEFNVVGENRVTEIVFDYADLAATGTATILANTVAIPAGARIEKANLYVETAFASAGSATLTIGTIDQDRSTVIDADGIDAAIAVAALTAGATIACDGAQVGTTLANTALITATEGTAAFTAGKGVLRIFWYIPE